MTVGYNFKRIEVRLCSCNSPLPRSTCGGKVLGPQPSGGASRKDGAVGKRRPAASLPLSLSLSHSLAPFSFCRLCGRRCQVVPGAKDFIDIVLSQTQRKTPTVVHKGNNITRVRQFYTRKVRGAPVAHWRRFA